MKTKKYQVKIIVIERYQKTVEVEAENENDARAKAEAIHEENDITQERDTLAYIELETRVQRKHT